MTEQVSQFLKKHGAEAAPTQKLKEYCEAFQAEMSAGLAGETSSLLMLPTYVSLDRQLPQNGHAVAMDAGGTNFRCAEVTLNDGIAAVGEQTVFPMPGSKGEIDKSEFLQTMASQLAQYPAGSRFGFCFSFPAEITPDTDGKVLYFDKEVRIRGGAGMQLVAEISETMRKNGQAVPERGCVINDTVATLLGGYLTESQKGYDGYIGFILGTGFNCCYSEKISNITKISGVSGDTMIINTEGGAYSHFPQSDFDRTLDLASENVHQHMYEKMISGAYVGEVIRLALQQVAKEQLFSDACCAAVAALEELPLAELSAFMDRNDTAWMDEHLNCTDEDLALVRGIADALLDRSAGYIAVCITAIIDRMDAGKDAAHPCAIMVEGSTFHKFAAYRNKIEQAMQALCTECYGRAWAFVPSIGANLAGAAAAALLK